MARTTELWVDRRDLRKTRIVESDWQTLEDGQVRVVIDCFGLTANNVSYAVTGDAIGYWGFYPAEERWGKVPVWGCADVIETNCSELPVGERLYGFFPMASHAVLRPGRIRDDQFVDVAVHRRELPSLYNGYRRTGAEPAFLSAMEIERCLLFPLFITSWLIYDYLRDNGFFGAKQVLIGSASSKTGFGLARLLHDDDEVVQHIVGLTSHANASFVKKLGCCDDVMVYGEEGTLDVSKAAAYVDMSGNSRLTATLHELFGENMAVSTMVGATHWEQRGRNADLPGAKPTFFFAPAQLAKRDKEWGPGVAMTKATTACIQLAGEALQEISVEWTRNARNLATRWVDLLDNRVAPDRGLMVSLSPS